MALSAPWPATCGMVAPSTTTGEEETEDGNGGNENENGNEDPKNENSDGGCWIFVAGVRERPPPLYSSSLARESVQGGFLGPAVGEGKVRGVDLEKGRKSCFFFLSSFFCLANYLS